MVGILIMTHGALGSQFIQTAKVIGIRSEEGVTSLSFDPTDSPESIRERVSKAIRTVNDGDGVLILTDLFGGTPTNISLTFLEEDKVEVVTGLNLPMIIKAINSRQDNHKLPVLAKLTSEAGKENIFLAGDFLRQRRAGKLSGK